MISAILPYLKQNTSKHFTDAFKAWDYSTGLRPIHSFLRSEFQLRSHSVSLQSSPQRPALFFKFVFTWGLYFVSFHPRNIKTQCLLNPITTPSLYRKSHVPCLQEQSAQAFETLPSSKAPGTNNRSSIPGCLWCLMSYSKHCGKR